MTKVQEQYDLIIIGGGLSATLLCLSILKRTKDFKILVIEKSDQFPQKIGESIIDLTAVFIKSLEVDHLFTEQLHKTGVRFLFNETNSDNLDHIAEFASPTFPGAIKGYHIDRSIIDQKLLDDVEKKGITVYRPATILNSSFKTFNNKLEVNFNGSIKKVKSRWVVDASGRARVIPKQLNWKNKKIGLNTGAIMAHFDNITLNSVWDTKQNNHWDQQAVGLRKFSTTHLMKENCWWWIIRLNDKRTSVGVVFDKNKVTFDNYEAFFQEQIDKDVQLKLMTKGATKGKVNYVENVPFVSDQLYSKGIALIGESGAFLDPFISPGLEMIGQQTIWLSELLVEDKKTGIFNSKEWKHYSKLFYKSYDSRLSIYKAAYEFMHSYDLFRLWLMQGNFIYFFKVVYPSVLFKSRIKYPLSFNFVEKTAVKYFSWRLNKINLKRKKEIRFSSYKENTLSYSGVKVPKNILLFPFVLFTLFFKSLWTYFSLEFTELKFKFKNSN
jgi:flavin-dependent dehydrogenase